MGGLFDLYFVYTDIYSINGRISKENRGSVTSTCVSNPV